MKHTAGYQTLPGKITDAFTEFVYSVVYMCTGVLYILQNNNLLLLIQSVNLIYLN